MEMTLEEKFGLLDKVWQTAAASDGGEPAALMFIDEDGDLAVVSFRQSDHPDKPELASACAQVLTMVMDQRLHLDWLAFAATAYVGTFHVADQPVEEIKRGDMQERYKADDPHVHEALVIVHVDDSGARLQQFSLPLHEPLLDTPMTGGGGQLVEILGGLWVATQLVAAIGEDGPDE